MQTTWACRETVMIQKNRLMGRFLCLGEKGTRGRINCRKTVGEVQKNTLGDYAEKKKGKSE